MVSSFKYHNTANSNTKQEYSKHEPYVTNVYEPQSKTPWT